MFEQPNKRLDKTKMTERPAALESWGLDFDFLVELNIKAKLILNDECGIAALNNLNTI